MEDILIQDLELGNCTDCIRVRASRFWEFFDPDNETKLLHADLVLTDEEGNNIHAQVYPPADKRIKDLVKEGKVYNFSCFRVKKANKYKPVKNDVMISLSQWTGIEEVVEVPPAFPVFTYSLTPIEQIPSCKDYTEYFRDVIGIVTAISNVTVVRTRERQADSTKRVVTIRSAGNASMDVTLWGERATSFPAEQVHTDAQKSPQVVIFVGTLIKRYTYSNQCTISLSGSSACRWYINPKVPEAKALVDSVGNMPQPVKWDQTMSSTVPPLVTEAKKISEIKSLNPFMNKKKEFLVTVTLKKIGSSWWYNACRCRRTAKPHGNSYKCSDPECGIIGEPTQRYKLCIVAGDETGDVDFIMFGRLVQRLTKKTVDTLIAENPRGFIPNEITNLLEKVFEWNVSFTQNTIDSGRVCFQVNVVVGEIKDGSALPMTPAGSQSSSLMLSQGACSSMQGTPQKSVSFPLLPTASDASHASSTTPTKKALNISEPPNTPHSKDTVADKHASPHDDNPDVNVDVPDDTATETTEKSATKKRSRPSHKKGISKKLQFTGEKTGDGADVSAVSSASKDD